MKKVLMFPYRFSPIAGAGVFRALKFTKYLPDFNWQSIILSVKNQNLQPVDKTLLGKNTNVPKVYRTNTIESEIYNWRPSVIGVNHKLLYYISGKNHDIFLFQGPIKELQISLFNLS